MNVFKIFRAIFLYYFYIRAILSVDVISDLFAVILKGGFLIETAKQNRSFVLSALS